MHILRPPSHNKPSSKEYFINIINMMVLIKIFAIPRALSLACDKRSFDTRLSRPPLFFQGGQDEIISPPRASAS